MDGAEERPALSLELTGAELHRWYWLRDELAQFAREVGVRVSGSKEMLTDRLAARLDGAPFTEPTARPPATGPQLTAPFSREDRVPAGQRCGQPLRAWFVAEVGPAFRFDRPMRDFFARADGTLTLGDAVELWHRSRAVAPQDIDRQFEYNRFTRRWHEEHPGCTAADARTAWWRHRSLPSDRRPPS